MKTLVFYHGNCPDGFGGAYSAWKKFGGSAEYVALAHQEPIPLDVTGATVYFIDFCYPKPVMDEVVAKAASVTVLDHHEGTADVVKSMPDFIYDDTRSGATIAWSFFHPDAAVPKLLTYVQEGDLYKFDLPDTRPLLKYAYSRPFDFEVWDALAAAFETPEGLARMIEKGSAYAEHADLLADQIANSAKLVEFEGYPVYFASTSRVLTNDVASRLYKKQPPFALIANARPDGIRISMRGNGAVDLTKIAQKYGGNGHPSSAAFSLRWGVDLPWKQIPDEDTRD